MIYNCGHYGCDICGGRECGGLALKKYRDILVCDICLVNALKFAISASEQFGGTITDPSKPCGRKKAINPKKED